MAVKKEKIAFSHGRYQIGDREGERLYSNFSGASKGIAGKVQGEGDRIEKA